MSLACLILICVSCCIIVALAVILICKKNEYWRVDSVRADRADKPRLCEKIADGSALSENEHIFEEFIKQHEKRILAFLIEEEANARSFAREKILALRDKYGTELVRPAYDAQNQLGKRGINPMVLIRLQNEWIAHNGGNANAHPSSREVERLLIERNRDKAALICEGTDN